MISEIPPPPDGEDDTGHTPRQPGELAQPTPAPAQRFGLSRAPLFELGRVVATPGALELLARTKTDATVLLNRHASGDWGAVGAHDAGANEYALHIGDRLLSVYELGEANEPLWIITESDRSATTLLRPAEY